MIYITGDTHIPVDIGKLSSRHFPEQKNMTKNDYLIICGDFGGVWNDGNEEKYWRRWLDGKRFTTLFVDGNHENFELLNGFSQVELCGGIVHRISDSIYHLMRGQIYCIDGKKIFTFGGASSHDTAFRKEGKSWWKEELPSELEMENAVQRIETENYCVDAVVSHCAPSSLQRQLSEEYNPDILTDFFEVLKGRMQYKKWFFGHYHTDKMLDERHRALFNDIIPLE